MKFIKKYYKAIIIIVIIALLIVGIGVSQVFIDNKKDNTPEDQRENNSEEILQSNERDDTVKQIIIKTDYINIRKDANVNSDVLGKVYKEEIYTVLEEKGTDFDWYLIETSNGIKGYIAGKSGEDVYVEVLPVQEVEEEVNKEENKPANNNSSNNTTKPNTNNNYNNNNSQNNNQTNDDPVSNDTPQEDNYEPQLPACLITSCDEGEELRNPDSVDCYCEQVSTYIPLNKVIYDKDGLTITIVAYNSAIKSYSSGLELSIVNNSTEPKTIQRDTLAFVNDINVTATVMSITLLPGTRGTTEIDWLDTSLERNGIEEIHKMQFKLKVIDWDGEGWPDANKSETTDWIIIEV